MLLNVQSISKTFVSFQDRDLPLGCGVEAFYVPEMKLEVEETFLPWRRSGVADDHSIWGRTS